MSHHAFRAMFAAALVALSCAAATVSAQPYPSKPIRIIVPFPAGGTADILARILGEKMAESFGQPVVIENRAGAAGGIGAALAATSPPDGYTLFMGTTGTQTMNPAINAKLGYDPLKDFAAVSNFAASPFVLVTQPSFPAKTLPALIELAKREPRKLKYATFGIGSSAHMTGEMFRSRAGVEIVHVPYKGAPQAITDVMAGHVDMTFSLLPTVLPHIKAGKVRAIAVAAPQRDPALPDVPTFAESGMPDFLSDSWYGILAPAGTPAPVVAQLNAEVNRVLALPEVRQRLAKEGATPVGNASAQFDEQIRRELAHWRTVARDAKITVE
jgi:tripartite-type tricarboxylate transporter receptor subunit TctC